MTSWLVTGGCGFVGSNLAASLLADGEEVIAFDNLSRVGSSMNLEWLRGIARRRGAGRFVFVHGDTRSHADIDAAFSEFGARVSVVAHLAGQVAMTTSIQRPRLDFEVNALGALNVLEGVRARAPDALVLFSSTNKVYGDLRSIRLVEAETRWTIPDCPFGLSEDVPLNFQSPYGCSKGAADQYFLDYHRMYGLRTVVFRHSSMYGGRQFATYDQGWVGWFCRQALLQKQSLEKKTTVEPFSIAGDGKQVRDLLHSNDLVECYRRASAAPSNCIGKAFNIGGGMENSLSLLELFQALELRLGIQVRYHKLPERPSDQRVFVADTRRAESAFGFVAKTNKHEGLQSMVSWCEESLALSL